MRHILVAVLLTAGTAYADKSVPKTVTATKLPSKIDEVEWLRVQLSAAQLDNIQKQIALSEITIRDLRKSLPDAQKAHDNLVKSVRDLYSISDRDVVDEKGTITRAATTNDKMVKK